MKSKEEILDRNGFDFDAFQYENEDLAKILLAAMEEYANQFNQCGHPPKQTYLIDGVWHCEKCGAKWDSISKTQSDANFEEFRKWANRCTNCGVSEVITDNHCNCCGAVQMSFLK